MTVFSFFTMQFFPPTQKIAITKYKVFFVNRETKNSFLLVPLKQCHYAYVVFYENSFFKKTVLNFFFEKRELSFTVFSSKNRSHFFSFLLRLIRLFWSIFASINIDFVIVFFKVAVFRLQLYEGCSFIKKETPTLLFSCEFGKVFRTPPWKNTIMEVFRATAAMVITWNIEFFFLYSNFLMFICLLG